MERVSSSEGSGLKVVEFYLVRKGWEGSLPYKCLHVGYTCHCIKRWRCVCVCVWWGGGGGGGR